MFKSENFYYLNYSHYLRIKVSYLAKFHKCLPFNVKMLKFFNYFSLEIFLMVSFYNLFGLNLNLNFNFFLFLNFHNSVTLLLYQINVQQ